MKALLILCNLFMGLIYAVAAMVAFAVVLPVFLWNSSMWFFDSRYKK